MAISDMEAMEIAQGDHYHAWALMPSVQRLDSGKLYSHLVYAGARQPHKDRSTARRHAKQMAQGDYGKAGYMALKCIGGEGCPLMHNPFPSWDWRQK